MSDGQLWDDELEELANRAARVLGQDGLLAVTDRVIRRLAAAAATTPISGPTVREALKIELRRLTRPN